MRLLALERELAEARSEIERLRTLLARLTQALRRARHDPLTGLADRGRADRWLARAVAWGLARRRPLALVMLDLDRFKQVNDTQGHLAGDALLRRTADVLRRWSDACARAGGGRPRVARFGGDEFLALLPGVDPVQAERLAEGLRAELARVLAPESAASLGLARLQPGDTPASVLGRADAALVRAKRCGRNRVATDDGPALPPG